MEQGRKERGRWERLEEGREARTEKGRVGRTEGVKNGRGGALNDINSTVCNFQSIFMRPAEKSFELTLVNQIIGNKVGEIAQ